jgi:inorganic pyrophosphatase
MHLPKPISTDEFFNVVIETPKGSRSKFAYDTKEEYFKLKKFLPAGTALPVDMGFIPKTKSGDGDPLDVFVFMEGPSYPGCVIECRIIGMLEVEQEARQESYRNDRALAIPVSSLEYSHVMEIDDLGADTLNDIINFCRYYNEMEGKKFSISNILKSDKAIQSIKKNYLQLLASAF